MGKKTKYDKLGVMGKREADMRMAKDYGIDVSQYGNTGRPGENYTNKKSYDDLRNDVTRAAANDYDVRRSIEAAQASGNKKAQKIGSISNASEAYAATRFMEKTHKNRMGNTGSYDGANDQGNVTNYWVNKDRDKFRASFASEEQATESTPDSTSVLEDYNDPIEFKHSPDLQAAQQRLDKYKQSIGKYNLFGKVNDNPPKADDQADAANMFTTNYKKDVSAAAGLKENKARNLNNAIDTVKNSSYRNQFM